MCSISVMSSPPGALRRFAPTPRCRPPIWGPAPPLAGPDDRRSDTRFGDEPGDPAARPRHPGGPCLLRPDRGAPRCGSHSSRGKRVRTARAQRGGKVHAAQRDQWADAAHCRRGGDRGQAGGEAVDLPNGAGKSTLLSVISGQMRPTAGEVVIGDKPVGKLSTQKLARTGLCSIPEGRGIFPNLTVRENLRIWTYRGGLSVKAVEEQTYATFPRLAGRRGQLAGTMSGGEQQMLAISRALVTDPKVLLLDELSMGLAPLIVSELYELVGTLAAQGKTVLLVEQFVTTALLVATGAAIMVHGEIRQQGTPSDMATAAHSIYLSN